MHDRQEGSGAVTLLLLLTITAILGFIGWRVYDSSTNIPGVASNTEVGPAPARHDHKRVVAMGDMVCDPKDVHRILRDQKYCQDDKTLALVTQLKPDAIFALGDLQYDDGTLEKFQNTFAKNWSSQKNIIYPSPGNHEYATPLANGYYTYFRDGPADVSKGYYSFLLGDWHILSLNSNCDNIGGCDPNSGQIKWLKEELNKNTAKCTLAFWHHPRFTSGKYKNDFDAKNRTVNMWDVLTADKADLVLNGHDHLYERFAKQNTSGEQSAAGMRQLTVGTGGKSLYPSDRPEKTSEKIIDNHYGVLLLDLYSNLYKWQFINTDGQTLDSGSQQCNY